MTVLTFLWRKSLSYRKQSTDLLCKSMDWFLYERDLRHERVKRHLEKTKGTKLSVFWILNDLGCYWNNCSMRATIFKALSLFFKRFSVCLQKSILIHFWLLTTQKMKFSITDFCSKYDQFAVSCGFDHIYWRNP